MRDLRWVLVALGVSSLVGCTDSQPRVPSPTPGGGPPATSASSASSASTAPSAPASGVGSSERSAPSVPPAAVAGTGSFYILSIPRAVSAPSATVCRTSEACDALLPPNPPAIVRRFDQEAWVVLATPAGLQVTSVVSDGATAEAALDPVCPPRGGTPSPEARLVLYRVAPTVTKAKLRLPASTGCPPHP